MGVTVSFYKTTVSFLVLINSIIENISLFCYHQESLFWEIKMSTPLENYLSSCGNKPTAAMCAYVSNLQQVASVNPKIAASIVNEIQNQRSHLKLIASENYCSLAVQSAMGNLLTDKYAEGYPEHRYYGGCVNVDAVEMEAAREAESLFGADYAYVQPHSGADTNLVAYWAILCAKVDSARLLTNAEQFSW